MNTTTGILTGHYSNEQDAFNAVRCVDGPRMSDPADVTKFNAALRPPPPLLRTPAIPPARPPTSARIWPVAPTLLPHRLHITGLPKTLVISTTGDPATPYANGVELAKEIGAQLLTANAVRHTSYLTSGDTCVDKIGTSLPGVVDAAGRQAPPVPDHAWSLTHNSINPRKWAMNRSCSASG